MAAMRLRLNPLTATTSPGGGCPHPRAPGALALSLDRGCRFSLFSAKPCTPMLNFFARSGRKIEKIDSLLDRERDRKQTPRRTGPKTSQTRRMTAYQYKRY